MARWVGVTLRGAGVLVALGALSLVLAACGGGSSNASSGNASDLKGANISGSAGQSGTAGADTPASVTTINISDNKFDPAEVTIKAGTTVRWVWSGSNAHSVMLAGQDSGQHTGSGTYERKFSDGGVTFPYQCGVHGAAMAGKIIVQ